MSVPVLIDAGPLVAMMNRRDEHHAWALTQMRTFIPPLKTCEAALAEAMHLLENHAGASQALPTLAKIPPRFILSVIS